MPFLIKSAAIVLSTAFWIALTLTFVQGFRLAHVGFPYADFPLAKHTRRMRWTWVLMLATLGFIEGATIPFFGRQYPPIFPFHRFCAVSTGILMLLATVFNPKWEWMRAHPGVHHLFGKLSWAFGTVAVLTGDIVIAGLRLPP